MEFLSKKKSKNNVFEIFLLFKIIVKKKDLKRGKIREKIMVRNFWKLVIWKCYFYKGSRKTNLKKGSYFGL